MTSETENKDEARGRLAYTAYGRAVDFKTHDGKIMPIFDELGPPQRTGWIAAAAFIHSLATTGRASL